MTGLGIYILRTGCSSRSTAAGFRRIVESRRRHILSHTRALARRRQRHKPAKPLLRKPTSISAPRRTSPYHFGRDSAFRRKASLPRELVRRRRGIIEKLNRQSTLCGGWARRQQFGLPDMLTVALMSHPRSGRCHAARDVRFRASHRAPAPYLRRIVAAGPLPARSARSMR